MSIKLVENTGYKYDPVYRFCGWEHAEDIRPVKTCGAETIGEFYLACLKAWSVETCSERFRPEWSAANPSVGQCTITAALVYEFFGGEVYSLPLDGGDALWGHVGLVGLVLGFERCDLLDFERCAGVALDAADALAAAQIAGEALAQQVEAYDLVVDFDHGLRPHVSAMMRS